MQYATKIKSGMAKGFLFGDRVKHVKSKKSMKLYRPQLVWKVKLASFD